MKRIVTVLTLVFSFNVLANSSVDKAVHLFNQQNYTRAEVIFEKEAREGNAYAMYWLGITHYKNGQQFKAGEILLKAAEMGSPWAMDVLAGNGNSPCKYLNWSCDAKWTEKAIPLWEKQASQGNGKAMYQLILRGKPWWETVPIYKYKKYEEIYSKAIPAGGYRFLFSSEVWRTSEEKLKYLKIAARQDYAPAMVSLYYALENHKTSEANEWIDRAINLGYAKAAETMFYTYSLGRESTAPDIKKAYYYNRLSGALGGEEREASSLTHENVTDEYGYPLSDENGNVIRKTLITEEERAELDKQVEDRIKDIKPNMFLDETSIDLF